MKKNKIKKLISFDFDDTLVHTPLPQEGKKIWKEKTGEDWPHRGWWSKPESLDTEIFDIPLNKKIHKRYQQAIKDPDNYVILATGRIEPLKNKVYEILGDYGLSFDETYLNPGIDTFEFKSNLFAKLIYEFQPEEFIMYDDRQEHLVRFVAWANAMPCKVTIIDAITGEEFKIEDDKNLQEQISRIQSMMDIINEEEESIISKLKKIKEFKNEGFKTAYVEDPYGKPDKTGELYYVFTQTNKGCEDLLSNTFISFSERNTAHWSGVKDISKADAILILTPKIEKNNVVFKLKLSWACELVYGDAAVEKIKNLIDDYNEKEKGVTVDDFLELRSFMLNKEEIKKLNNQSEEDAKLSYTPPKPSSIDEKDFVFSATSDGNISVSVLKTYPSDKDPSRLFYFNGPMVTYNPVIYGPLGIEIELNITEYNNETNTLTMDLSKCDYAACKDKNGNPKVITTTLNKIKPKILKSVTDGYKVNNFKLIELEVNAKDENNKDTSKDVGLIPLNTTIASKWTNFVGDNTSLMAKDEKEKLKEQISRIKSMMSN